MLPVSTVLSIGGLNDFKWFIVELHVSRFFSDYTEFLEDLEEDPVLRQNVNVYKGISSPLWELSITCYLLDERKINQTGNSMENEEANDDDIPRIGLDEMLADMTMEDSDKMDA